MSPPRAASLLKRGRRIMPRAEDARAAAAAAGTKSKTNAMLKPARC